MAVRLGPYRCEGERPEIEPAVDDDPVEVSGRVER
jgi:hypothetical protein